MFGLILDTFDVLLRGIRYILLHTVYFFIITIFVAAIPLWTFQHNNVTAAIATAYLWPYLIVSWLFIFLRFEPGVRLLNGIDIRLAVIFNSILPRIIFENWFFKYSIKNRISENKLDLNDRIIIYAVINFILSFLYWINVKFFQIPNIGFHNY